MKPNRTQSEELCTKWENEKYINRELLLKTRAKKKTRYNTKTIEMDGENRRTEKRNWYMHNKNRVYVCRGISDDRSIDETIGLNDGKNMPHTF